MSEDPAVSGSALTVTLGLLVTVTLGGSVLISLVEDTWFLARWGFIVSVTLVLLVLSYRLVRAVEYLAYTRPRSE